MLITSQSLFLLAVLVFQGCLDKVAQTGGLNNRKLLSHTVPEIRSPNLRCMKGHAPSETYREESFLFSS